MRTTLTMIATLVAAFLLGAGSVSAGDVELPADYGLPQQQVDNYTWETRGQYVVNASLPLNQVELAPDVVPQFGNYRSRPDPRTPEVAGWAEVQVFWHDHFVGWVWLQPEFVNYLHAGTKEGL